MPDPLKTIQGKSGLPSPDLGNKVRLSFSLPRALTMGYPVLACSLRHIESAFPCNLCTLCWPYVKQQLVQGQRLFRHCCARQVGQICLTALRAAHGFCPKHQSITLAMQFGGGPKVPTFGTNPNLAKNSVVEKALTDNSPTVQFNKKN